MPGIINLLFCYYHSSTVISFSSSIPMSATRILPQYGVAKCCK